MSDASTLFWLAAASCGEVFDADPAFVRFADRAASRLAGSRFNPGEKGADQLTNLNSINNGRT
jgi:hypothetical protein